MSPMLKRCPQCNGRFIPKRETQRFCGWTCQRQHAAQNKPVTLRATEETAKASRKAINARHWQKRKAAAEALSGVSGIASSKA